jgi:hypothetical protein
MPASSKPVDGKRTRTTLRMGVDTTDDKLMLVEVVSKLGKNWQKVLHDLQTNKHAFLHVASEKANEKLREVYRNFGKALVANDGMFPMVSLKVATILLTITTVG